jgi:hypothetical protein
MTLKCNSYEKRHWVFGWTGFGWTQSWAQLWAENFGTNFGPNLGLDKMAQSWAG